MCLPLDMSGLSLKWNTGHLNSMGGKIKQLMVFFPFQVFLKFSVINFPKALMPANMYMLINEKREKRKYVTNEY